jgi:hypothetical protein
MNAPDQALIQQTQISSLNAPHSEDIHELRNWLGRPKYGSGFVAGSVEGVWDTERKNSDFVTFQAVGGLAYEFSRFFLYLSRFLAPKQDIPDRVYHLNASPSGGFTNGIVTIVSSIFPVLPIIILFFIHRLLIRLILILAFTALFSAILVFGVRLKPDQVLAITTAYVRQKLMASYALR